MKKKDKKKILKYIDKIAPTLKGTIHVDELLRLIKIKEQLEKKEKINLCKLDLTLIQSL